jgi:peptidoglycan/xylan/chitin deacetylase (PgdA/CDA1 family)
MKKISLLSSFVAISLLISTFPLNALAITEVVSSSSTSTSSSSSSSSSSVSVTVNSSSSSSSSNSSNVSVTVNSSSSTNTSVNKPANLVLNNSFEQLGAPAKSLNWNDFGDGYARTTLNRHSGNAAIELVRNTDVGNSGASQRINLSQTAIKPVFIGAYVKGKNIVMRPGTWLGASIYAEIHLTNGNVVYWNSVPSMGTFDWRWVGFNTGTLTNINAPIDYIFVVPILGASSGTAYFDDITISEFTPAQGAITFMFDDGETTTLTEGKKKLDTVGFKGSAAIISSEVGSAGYMNKQQLLTLQRGGWEIVSHSVSHEDLTLMTPANYNKELLSSKNSLTALGLKVNNFGLPFGAYNADIMANAAKYYSSARAYESGDNPRGAFPFDVKVRGLLSSTPISEVKSWIDKAKNEKRWEVFVFHSIVENGDDEYHSTPKQLSDIVDLVKASGLSVITYNQGIQMFATTP